MEKLKRTSAQTCMGMLATMLVIAFAAACLAPGVAFAHGDGAQKTASPRMAYAQYFFDFNKASGANVCGPAQYMGFANQAQMNAENGDIYFVEGSSKMRAWITDGNGNPKSNTAVVSYLNTMYYMNY